MDDLLPRLIVLSWGVSIVGWLWLVVLGFVHRGIGMGLGFFLVGPWAAIWGYHSWRRPTGSERTGIPFFMLAGGMSLTVLLVLLS